MFASRCVLDRSGVRRLCFFGLRSQLLRSNTSSLLFSRRYGSTEGFTDEKWEEYSKSFIPPNQRQEFLRVAKKVTPDANNPFSNINSIVPKSANHLYLSVSEAVLLSMGLEHHKRYFDAVSIILRILNKQLDPADKSVFPREQATSLLKRGYSLVEKQMEEANLPREFPQLIHSLSDAAVRLHEYDLSLSFCSQALEVTQVLHRGDHDDIAICLNNLGTAYHYCSKFEEALRSHKEALAMRERLYGDCHPHVAISHQNISNLLFDKCNYKESLTHYLEAMRIYEEHYGTEHEKVALSKNSVSNLYRTLNMLAEARRYQEEGIEILKKLKHKDLAISYLNLGGILGEQGNEDESVTYLEDGLEEARKTLGPEDPVTVTGLALLGSHYRALRDYNKAQEYYEASLGIATKALGGHHSQVGSVLQLLAETLMSQQNYSEALHHQQRALEIFERVNDVQNMKLALKNLVSISVSLGNDEDANIYQQRETTLRK